MNMACCKEGELNLLNSVRVVSSLPVSLFRFFCLHLYYQNDQKMVMYFFGEFFV